MQSEYHLALLIGSIRADKRCAVCSLPGSIVESQLHESFYRMLPELLKYSSASRLLSSIPEEVQAIHRKNAIQPCQSIYTAPVPVGAPMPSSSSFLWEGWNDATDLPTAGPGLYDCDDEEDIDLSLMGL